MLTLTNVQIVYDNTIEAVREASLALGKQQIVALLGANGAGKSTTLKAISGVLYPEDGEVKGGQITFEGQPLTGMTPDRIVRAGVVMVPEGRRLFDQLTVEENLLMGGYTRSVAESKRGLERVYATFPRLTPKRATVSGYLSGGEQQMVAIGRALMSAPKLLMLDEPTLGLAPQICEEIFAIVTRRNAILVLMGLELVLNAANLNLIAFSRYGGGNLDGQVAAIFVIILAAAEAAVALAIVLNIYHRFQTVNVDEISSLKE